MCCILCEFETLLMGELYAPLTLMKKRILMSYWGYNNIIEAWGSDHIIILNEWMSEYDEL